MKTKHFYILIIFTLILSGCKEQTDLVESKKIEFQISDYNLLFTTVSINDKTYTALIDFGDFADFQISTKLIAELGLKTEKSDIIMSDINGNQYALEKGEIPQVSVNGIIENNITFFSANNEIEMVSKEVGTDFQVVIGFGYFKTKDFKLDFTDNSIEFLKTSGNTNDFTVSVNTDYGYLIGNFKSSVKDSVNLLFDTGTPISKIDLNVLKLDLEDAVVNFQQTEFPSKSLNVKSGKQILTLNMENNDVSELQPLVAVGIFGVNDMIDKVFFYNALEKTLSIENK